MGRKLDGRVNSLQFVDYALHAVKQNEQLEDRPAKVKQQNETYLGLLIHQSTKIKL